MDFAAVAKAKAIEKQCEKALKDGTVKDSEEGTLEDQDLIEYFDILPVQDDDWHNLYNRIMDERKKNNLTITDFLVSCGLNPKIIF